MFLESQWGLMPEHLKVVLWDPQPSVRVSTVTSWFNTLHPQVCVTDEWRMIHASSACLKGSITLDPRKTQKDKEEARVGWPSCSAPLYFPLLYAAPAKPHCNLRWFSKFHLPECVLGPGRAPSVKRIDGDVWTHDVWLGALAAREYDIWSSRIVELDDVMQNQLLTRGVCPMFHSLFSGKHARTNLFLSPIPPSGWMLARRNPPPAVVAPLPREGSSGGAALAQRARRKRTDNRNFCLDR